VSCRLPAASSLPLAVRIAPPLRALPLQRRLAGPLAQGRPVAAAEARRAGRSQLPPAAASGAGDAARALVPDVLPGAAAAALRPQSTSFRFECGAATFCVSLDAQLVGLRPQICQTRAQSVLSCALDSRPVNAKQPAEAGAQDSGAASHERQPARLDVRADL
jgi:hypothetical protein